MASHGRRWEGVALKHDSSIYCKEFNYINPKSLIKAKQNLSHS